MRNKLEAVLAQLKGLYTLHLEDFALLKALSEGCSDFEALVAAILSQNTSDASAVKAFERLRLILGGRVTPEAILSAEDRAIIDAIKVAGLSARKLNTLRALANLIKSRPSLLSEIQFMDVESARRLLMSVRGIGPKTADVFLLMVHQKPTFPIDTHVARILTRLCLVGNIRGYEAIRRAVVLSLQGDVEKLTHLHLLLIEHGRLTCKARRPRCHACVLRSFCATAPRA